MKKIILTILTILVVSLPSSAGVIIAHSHHHGEDESKVALALLIAINLISVTVMLVRAMVWAWNKKTRKEYINSPISYVFGNLKDDSLLPAMINTACIAIIDLVAIVILLAMLIETLL